jgi:hypothetical protein
MTLHESGRENTMIRSIHFGIISALTLAIGGGLALSGSAQDKASIVGISLAQKDPNSEYGQSVVPGWPAGTQVYLRVELPERTLLNIDSDESMISLTDSTGATMDVGSNFGLFAFIADDRHSFVLPIQSEVLPAAGASSIRVEGTIACNCGAEPKTETVAVSLAVDQELTLGPVTAKVTQVGDGFEPDSQRIDLESNSPFDLLESVMFLDSDGKEVKTRETGGGKYSFGNATTYSQSYEISGNAEQIRSARFTYYQQVESAKIPVDTVVGLDLGSSR